MAVVVSSNSGKWHYAIKHFICDVAADVRDLPIDGVWPGSTAYVVDTCESYIFNSSREWIKITNNSSGSGAGLAATIQVGNVATGQPGSEVTITNSGTTSAAVFDFSIPRGEPFQIKEVYDSIAAMKADYNNPDLNVGDLVAIVSDPSDPDNASLYVKGDTQFEFFMDLSGAQGIQGPAGPQGEKGDAFTYSDFSPAQLESLIGPRGPQGPEGNGISNITQNPDGTLTITMDDGDQYTVDVEAFIDKMDKTNPTGTGYFSLNRKANTTIGTDSFAEGHNTTASGTYSHAEGQLTTASATDAHAEGSGTTASGNHSHAEGIGTTASGTNSHAEGFVTTASGSPSHAEGSGTTASGNHSHAEGYNTTASGEFSHAEGYYAIANHKSQHVFGEYNIADPSSAAATARGNYVEIVGNGTSGYTKSNARTLDWDGNETLAGNLTIGGTPTNNDHAATKKYVDDAVASATELPTPAAGDNGKVLTVNSDLEYGLEAVPDELPAVTSSDNTKILTVSGGKWAKGSKIPVPTAAGKLLQSKANGDFELIDNAMPMNWEEVTYQTVQADRTGKILTTAADISRMIQRLTYGQRTTIYSVINGAYVIWRVCAFSNNNITVQRMYVTDNGDHYSEMGIISGTTNFTSIKRLY